ncbi:toll/interleukin-1 receptor domain-containing protein [Streptomyces sp. NPDC017966]|uniref:toll/interleukin-1 receptor domain-containing protein n=1 Tax=Streptomyces sp. NPDC017966 TaxID=3365023 RepID=UPI00378E6BCF
MGEERLSLFYSYAHEDETLRDHLAKHLKILERQHVIRGWHDREISAGTEWRGEIDQNLQAADIVLLLISPDFIASDYCYDIELAESLRRHNLGECIVIPVILRAVETTGAPFMMLQALPKDAKPVTAWGDRDAAFANVAAGIRKAASQIVAARKPGVQENLGKLKSAPMHSRDADRMQGYRKIFDRPAFSRPCIFEDSIEEVSWACDQITLAMLTGAAKSPPWDRTLYQVAQHGEFETEPFISSLAQIRDYLAEVKRTVNYLRHHLATPDVMMGKARRWRIFGGRRKEIFGMQGEKIWHMEFYLSSLIRSGVASKDYIRDAISLMDRVDLERNAILRIANGLFQISGLAEVPEITLSSRLIQLSEQMRPYSWDRFYLRNHALLRDFLSEDD